MVLAVFSFPVSNAQTQPTTIANPAARKHYTVSGTVVNSVTGEPLRRALVRANGPEQHAAALTGADGHFQMEGVPDGLVYLSAEKPGFFEESSIPGARGITRKAVTVGPATPEVSLKLVPEARIRGRVVDREGEPIESLQITVMTQQIINGRKQWQSRGGGTTNANGVYHLDGLTPGRHVVRTGSQPVIPPFVSVVSEVRNVPDQVFPQMYFPDSLDASSAQALDLKPGEEAEADFTLSAVRAYKVSGVIAGSQQNVMAICEDSAGEPIQTGVHIDQKTGRFVLSNIPAGSYTIAFRRQEQQGNAYYAEQRVTITTSDVDGVNLLLQPLLSIPVNFPGAPERTNPQVNVQLISKQKHQGQGAMYGAQRQGGPEGPLVIPSVAPGTYEVSAQTFGDSCIQSITSGNIDLSRDDLTVSAGSQPAPIDVAVGNDCATLSGTVHADGQPAGGVVILVRDESSAEPKVAFVPPSGVFSFAGLTPGDYQIFAFSDLAGLEYGNPDAMKGFTGQEINLGSNQKAQIDVKLNLRGQN